VTRTRVGGDAPPRFVSLVAKARPVTGREGAPRALPPNESASVALTPMIAAAGRFTAMVFDQATGDALG